ncbi:MAG: SDR family oxidoreductase [Oscillatoriales cyanobacterium RU_3_3]|nr:SDR family oxidoreductase [Microcoleus sp. SU_5_6]NJL69202.1 SDR family oxidoreductase [Microcoleus sp. SM1_3_4]NJM63133.1 SDR family oxidoreductase [Oscillatoriales cyanobacterium RU_3_3]NJR23988.1 SDR family oxidoreductase [Richelia sp. CSU_2_1]
MKKLIVITGVSRGLGLAMTEKFIELGHTVLGCARSPEAVERLNSKYNFPHHFTCADVANNSQIQAWAEEILANYSPPDLLINNAALTNRLGTLWEISSEEFSEVIDVNIKGTANTIRHFVPSMIARNSGIIVNFSSGWGRSTSPEVAPYCATKWAIEGLTRSLAQELPRGMAAIPLNPGIIHTDMLEISFGESAANYTPVKAWVQKAVPFLLKLKPSDNGVPMTVPG